MAHVQSLGLHEPCALQYLINESLLRSQPSSPPTKWHIYPVYDQWGKEISEEEILQTRSCVVWSRGGVVKRAFNLEVENEEILHSFVTRFPKLIGNIQKQGATIHDLNERCPGPALVVILKSKAHIYFLAGDMHTVPLPFEVVNAFPTPQGCLLQRKTAPSELKATTITVPPNSFVSSQPWSNPQQSPQVKLKAALNLGISLTLSPVDWQFAGVAAECKNHVPSVFSMTDTQAELGVAAIQSLAPAAAKTPPEYVEQSFDQAEEIIYVSRSDERPTTSSSQIEPLLLAVTRNAKSSTITVWKVWYRPREKYDSPSEVGKSAYKGKGTRRRSSNLLRASGSATPIGRSIGGSRESLGSQRDLSFPAAHLTHEHDEHRSGEVDRLATELGPDFGHVGVQTRAARRVSSILARTDLSMVPDRTPIAGIASGDPGRRRSQRTGLRDKSLGGSTERQGYGPPPGGTFAGVSKFFSDESSFLDATVDQILEGVNSGGDVEGFKTMSSDDAMNELPTEALFSKVHAFPYPDPTIDRESSVGRFKAFSLTTAPREKVGNAATAQTSVCIMDGKKSELAVVTLESIPRLSKERRRKKTAAQTTPPSERLRVTVINFQRVASIVDACKLQDGDHSSLLILTKGRDGQMTLLLEVLGIASVTINLPETLLIHDPLLTRPAHDSEQVREAGRGRIVKVELRNVLALKNSSVHGQVDLVDARGHLHRVQIQLEPRHPLVKKILTTVEFALHGHGGSSVHVAWIEVMKWLRAKERKRNLEWSAMVVTLFCMFVPFISDKPKKTRLSTRRANESRISSSAGAPVDMRSWNEMMDEECGSGKTSPNWSIGSGWRWIGLQTEPSKGSTQPQQWRSGGNRKSLAAPEGKGNTTGILQYVSWTREFLQTAIGEQMIGNEGFLPTSLSRARDSRKTAMARLLVALHLLREEQKLDIRASQCYENGLQLLPVLAQIGHWLSWPSWEVRDGCYYSAEMADMEEQLFDGNIVPSLDLPEPFVPPSVFDFVEGSLSRAQARPFLTLLDVVGNQDSVGQQTMKSRAELLTPRTFALVTFFTQFASLQTWQATVECMYSCNMDAQMIATMPTGITAAFHEAISHCEGLHPPSWSAHLLRLIGRDGGMAQSMSSISSSRAGKPHGATSHDSARDYHSIGSLVLDTEPSHSWDASSEADRQGITRLIFREDRRFQDASRLVNQLRPSVAECPSEPDWSEADLLEAQKEVVQLVAMRTLTVASGRGMMNYSSRVPLLTEKVTIPAFTLQCQIKPSNVTSSADRAAFTEDRAVWAFFHNGTAAGLTVSRDARGIDTSWILYNKPPELTNRHAGFLLALGLNGHLKSLAKWVAFKYLTPKHTMTSIGFLLGLSASHLGTMDTSITRLLSVHVTRMLPAGAAELNLSPLTQTTGIMGIGLLYCSSQHRRMSEVMLSEVENSDVEEGIPAEQIIRDEGYRLAAGFALGFINLGQGRRLHALHDMNIMSRLLSIAISTKNVNLVHVLDRATSGAVVAYALIYLKTNDASIAKKIDIPDTIHQFGYVRPDIFLLRTLARHLIMWDSITPTFDFIRASLPKAYRRRASLSDTRALASEDMPFFNILAGVCLALGLRFAGSGSYPVRDLLTSYLDHFMRLTRLPAVNYDNKLTRNAVRNCQDVTALALAAIMSGTGDIVAFRRLRSLHGRVDPDTPYGSHLAAHMAIGVLFLGGGTYTLATSDLAVASLLCAFYPIFPTSVTDNHAHLQAFRHLWVLAAEARCVVPRMVDSGKLISVPISIVMKDRRDKAGTAMALTTEERERRLTAPCLIPDLDEIEEIRTRARGYWDVRISFVNNDKDGKKDGDSRRDEFRKGHLNIFLRRRTAYDAPKSSVFVSELQALAEQGPAPSVAGLSTSNAPSGPLLGGVNASIGGVGGGADKTPFEWLWQLPVFHDLDVRERALVLPPLQHYALNNNATITTGDTANGQEQQARTALSTNYLRSTVVDTRLELEHGILNDDDNNNRPHHQSFTTSQATSRRKKTRNPNQTLIPNRDSLWQLRLLFAWSDASDRREQQLLLQRRQQQQQQARSQSQAIGSGGGNHTDNGIGGGGGGVAGDGSDDTGGTWLRREVIERLRWRVWKMKMGIDKDEDEAEVEDGGAGGGGS